MEKPYKEKPSVFQKRAGVPRFECYEFHPRECDYVVLIPVMNENGRIIKELKRACRYQINKDADVVLCDGGSTDGSMEKQRLRNLNVNTLLIKRDSGKQGAQLRMGFWWALQRGYQGIITIDGNNKDSIEDIPNFIEKLKEGYDFIQGSRFITGGKAVHTPLLRLIAIKFIHAPMISLTAHWRFTDTTNAYRAYSPRYLQDKKVQPLREIFTGYELLAYLSVRATQLGYRVCEIPVARVYPREGNIPTKISLFKGNFELLKILMKNLLGAYHP